MTFDYLLWFYVKWFVGTFGVIYLLQNGGRIYRGLKRKNSNPQQNNREGRA